MTVSTEETLPGMPDLPPLWAVHVQGADDIYAMPSKKEAEELAGALDKLDKENASRKYMPRYSAVVVEWAGTREEHAQALIDQAED